MLLEGKKLVVTGVLTKDSIAATVAELARRLEHDIAAAPEQWWGAFQPFWPDLDPVAAP